MGPTAAGKWMGFVSAIWVQAITGNNYTFSNYSDALKTLMSLTQLQLNNLSVAKDVGKAFGILAGIACDRFPIPVILLIGSVEGFIGYGAQWLVVSRRIQPLPYWAMSIFLCMGGNSTTWMNTAVIVNCIRHFPKNRGPVSGIMKSYVGLTSAIFTAISSALFSNDPATFLLLLVFFPLLVCLNAMVFLKEAKPSSSAGEEAEETKYFGIINVIAISMAFYMLAFDLTGANTHSNSISKVFAFVLFCFLVSPVGIPVYIYFKNAFWSKSLDLDGNPEQIAPLLIEETPMVDVVMEDGGLEMNKRKPLIGEDHTISEAMWTADFWLLFVSFLCGVGTGLAMMNNLGQISVALGYSDVSTFVSLTSISGFFGRLLSGSLSEYYIKRYGTSRPRWNAASQILMAIGYAVMAMAFPGCLYIGSIVVGICYGARVAITVTVASELFGLKHYGLIYNILLLNLPLGSLLFSGLLAGFIYDTQATLIPGGGNTCVGAHCYRLVFVVMALSCILGLGLDLMLSVRTKSLYSKICATKLR